MDDIIVHYGVKGMKWGIRRPRKDREKQKMREDQEPEHEDYKRAHDSKSVKTMSDAELRSRINRIQMEQQYSKLNPTTISKGRNTVNKILKASGTIAGATTTALTLYGNVGKISKIMETINPEIKRNLAGAVGSVIIRGAAAKK